MMKNDDEQSHSALVVFYFTRFFDKTMMHLDFFVFAVLTASSLVQSLEHGKPKSS